MNKPSLLFVEEVENSLSRKIVSTDNINLVLLRFQQSMGFKEEHLSRTKDIPTFVLDKNNSINDEAVKFCNFCKDNDLDIEYFYNDSEYNQELVQKFANILGLKNSLNDYQAKCVRDKVVMKDFLNKIGLETVAYKELESIDDAISFAKDHGFPIIVKWRRGLSSKEVYKVNSEKEILDLNLDYSEKRFMAEAYCNDLIWCIDALVQDGIVLVVFLTWLPYTNLSFAVNKEKFAQITVSSKPEEIKFDDKKLMQLVVDHLELKNGYIHLEAFVNSSGQPVICEFAWRTPGEHMLLNHSIAFNTDVYALLVDIMVGRKVHISNLKGVQCVGDMFLPLKEGVVKKISSYEDIKTLEGVIGGEVLYKIADQIKSKRQYTDSAGWIQVVGDNKDQVVSRMLKVYEHFNLIAE